MASTVTGELTEMKMTLDRMAMAVEDLEGKIGPILMIPTPKEEHEGDYPKSGVEIVDAMADQRRRLDRLATYVISLSDRVAIDAQKMVQADPQGAMVSGPRVVPGS